MLTRVEEDIRKAVGVFFGALFVWQAWLMITTGATTINFGGSPYVVLAVLAANFGGWLGTGFLSI